MRLLLILLATLSTAPQAEPGQIIGVVKDNQGRALPGVLVTATAPGMPPRSAVTESAGTYQMTRVAPATYALKFELNPTFFPMTRENVVVGAGRTVQVNADLASTGPRTRIDAETDVRVRIETEHGAIVLALDRTHAPLTVANFLKYVDGGFYTGGRFHRATRPDNYTPAPPDRPAMQIIQGGINPARDADAKAIPPVPLERTTLTGLKHVAGVVSMARGADADSGRSDFFILLDDQPSMDVGGKRYPDGQGFAAFGRVVEGLDVVKKINAQPVKDQALTPPVPIRSITRVK